MEDGVVYCERQKLSKSTSVVRGCERKHSKTVARVRKSRKETAVFPLMWDTRRVVGGNLARLRLGLYRVNDPRPPIFFRTEVFSYEPRSSLAQKELTFWLETGSRNYFHASDTGPDGF